MSVFALAVLDMAGTTIRDDGLVEHAVSEAVRQIRPERLGSNFSSIFHSSRGASKVAMFEEILGRHEDAVVALGLFESMLIRGIHEGAVEAIDGAEETIGTLRRRGLKVALATGFPLLVRNALLEHLGWQDLVDAVLGPESGRGRPAPDIVLNALMQLEIDSVQQVAVVGDTQNDLLCGTRSGAGLVCGVLTGAHDRSILTEAPHHLILESIRDLPDAMLTHSGPERRAQASGSQQPQGVRCGS